MSPQTTKTSRRRRVTQQPVPYDLNELTFFLGYTDESVVIKPRKRRPKARKAKQEDDKLSEVRSESPLFPADEYELPDSPLFPEQNDFEINTTEWERSNEVMAEVTVAQIPEPEGAVVLDPEYSERQYYREPLTGYQREIWRPGDGDGSQSTDYYQRTGPVLPVDQRWRLFQCNIGPLGLGNGKREPPRFVFLDDRAAYEVLTSDIQRARLNREWPHDFAANGKMRARRTHCGRPAFKDPLTSEFQFAPLNKTSKYVFTGEKDYRPIIYRIPPPPPPEPSVEELNRKRKAEAEADPELYNPRAHGHNQYTPKDIMVKHGAPTFSKKKSQGGESEILATLKAQKKFFTEGPSRHGSSSGESFLSRPKTVSSGVRSVDFNATISTPEAFNGASDAPWQYQGEGEDSGSDIELFARPVVSPRSRVSTPAPTAAVTLGLPRQMGYIDRRLHEQALALETENSVQNQDDVVRISSELAEADVALADQAKEIGRQAREIGRQAREIDGLKRILKENGYVVEDMPLMTEECEMDDMQAEKMEA